MSIARLAIYCFPILPFLKAIQVFIMAKLFPLPLEATRGLNFHFFVQQVQSLLSSPL